AAQSEIVRFCIIGATVAIAALAPAQEAPGLKSAVARASQATDRNDCPAAIPLWREAAEVARRENAAGDLPLIYRRLGICLARTGDSEAALSAYSSGREASRAAHDNEMLIENTHGAATALRRMGRIPEAFEAARQEFALAEKCQHPQHLVPALQQLSLLYGNTG